MKKILLTIAAACGCAALVAFGQPSPPFSAVTVDVARAYANYQQAERSKEQFQRAVERAQAEMRTMLDEGVALAKELQEIEERMDNPALSEAAREKLRKQGEEKADEVRKKEVEVNSFRQQTDRELMERREEFVGKHIEEIRLAAEKLAKKKKVQVALNVSTGAVLYAVPALDITDEVIQYLNGKD
ncbi:MAG: OmpH family outer membrane protein [Puniceicoccales bacterium]|jgi:Skp family chaperone for outer membrane proteins|nr:OmpH family outer membrane protein [Puniceicoccales bacterium]